MGARGQGQNKRLSWFSKRNFFITIIVFVAVATISILGWKYWAIILDIWKRTPWLQWIIFVGIVLLTIVSTLLWVFRSQGIARRTRVASAVLAAIAIGAGIWILSTLGIISGVAGNVMLAIFTALAAAFTFLQLVNPYASQSSDTAPRTPPTAVNTPNQSSSLQQPADTVLQSPLPVPSQVAKDTPQSVSIQQNGAIDFFISYAAADLIYARWIERVLREAKYSTFFPDYDMGPGSNIPQELNRATAIAKRTLLVLSPNFPLSDHPEWTVSFYKDMAGKGRKLIPVYVRKCPEQLQGVLAPIVPIDLIEKNESEARELLLEGVYSGDRRKRQITPPKFPGLSSDNHGTGS
jgi:hypothetical protein